MSNNMQWTQEQIMLFLECVQTETVIWDPHDKCHKDKRKINDAWVRIRNVLGGNNISVEELKKRKESLFATYRGYCRKIQASVKSGAGVDDVYRPAWFAFEFMNNFLGSVFKCKQTIATDQESGSVDEENNSSEGVISTATVKENSIDPSQLRHTIRRRDNPPELQVASKQMTEAFNNLNEIIKNKPAKDSTEVEDECDIFGKLIAKKLKKLSEHKREDLMFDIHGLFQRSRDDRSPSVESFRSSTPIYTSHHSSTPSLPSKKRPKYANTALYYNATTLSPRPHSSHSEPPNTYITFSNQSNESQHTYIQQPNENSPHQGSSKICVIRNEVLVPETQSQPVRLHYKRSESENTGVYNVKKVPPPSDISNDGQYMLHIQERETQAASPDDNTHNNDNLIYQAYYES